MCIYITLWASPMIHFVYRCTHLSVDVPILLTGHLGMGLVLGLEVEVLVAHIVWLSWHQALVLEHFHRSVVDQVILQGVPPPTHPYHQVTILQELRVKHKIHEFYILISINHKHVTFEEDVSTITMKV